MTLRRIVLIGCAAAAAGLAMWLLPREPAEDRSSLAHELSLRPQRLFAARLSAPFVSHAPYRVRRGDAARPDLSLRAVAAQILHVRNAPREVAVAHAVFGDLDAAADALRDLCARSSADACADLSAVHLALAETPDRFTANVDALAAANRALTLAPQHAPASFNRALALERLGLATHSRTEWRRAAALDPESAWAREAQAAAERLAPKPSKQWDRAALANAAAADDTNACRRLVRDFSREARSWGESVIPAEWAESVMRGDAAEAERLLRALSIIAAAIRAETGERMAEDAVEVMRRASARERGELAAAYLRYREGRIAHSKHKPLEAYAHFVAAERLFASAGSPMALTARYYAGSALWAQGRAADVDALLGPMSGMELAGRGYRNLEAHVGWEHGLALVARGALSDGVRAFERSRENFVALHDDFSRTAIDAFLADTLEEIGETERAWVVRRDVFAAAGERLSVTLAAAVDVLVRNGELERAHALAGVSITESLSRHNPTLITQAYLGRAATRAPLQDERGRNDLAEAKRWRARVSDPAIGRRLDAELAFATGLLLARDEPANALASFDAAAAVLEGERRPRAVTRVYLERARVLRRLEKYDDARPDLAKTIAILERRRRGVHDAEQRALTLATASDVYAEAVALELQAGDEEAAFAMSERARARALLDLFERRDLTIGEEARPLAPNEIRDALAPDAAIVAHARIPEGMASFVVRPDGVRVTNDVALGLDGVAHVTVVADPDLARSPITASLGPQFRTVTEAPSATIAIRCAQRARDTATSRVLVLAATEFDRTFTPLPAAAIEAQRVRVLYADATLVQGAAVTPARVVEELPRAGIVHYSGHAVGERRSARAHLPLARGTLDALTISRLDLMRTRFVYLSACDSAKSERMDGVSSLALAFLVAGVPSVVAAKWEVDDTNAPAAAERLHRTVARGEDPATAARTAHSSASHLGFAVIGASRYLVR